MITLSRFHTGQTLFSNARWHVKIAVTRTLKWMLYCPGTRSILAYYRKKFKRSRVGRLSNLTRTALMLITYSIVGFPHFISPGEIFCAAIQRDINSAVSYRWWDAYLIVSRYCSIETACVRMRFARTRERMYSASLIASMHRRWLDDAR